MAAIDAIGFVPWMAVWAAHAGERMLEITWPRISRCPWPEGAIRNHGYLMLYGSVRANTYRYIFSGMNIHLPAILGFTRYQGSEKDVWYWDGNGRISSRYGHNHGHAITPRTAHCTCHKGLWCCVSEAVSSTSGEDPRRKRPGLGAVLSPFAYPEIFILQL